MKRRMKVGTALAVVVVGLLLVGCGPEKARALRTAVVQFKVEALDAIDAIDTWMSRELETSPRASSTANEEFVTNILELDSLELTPEVIELASDPYKVETDAELTQAREEFKAGLIEQYSTFATIFDDLEKANFVAAAAVKKSAPYAEKLTIQMAAFAKSLSHHPPKLLQYRSTVISEIDLVRLDTSLSFDEKRIRLLELKERWESIKKQESELQRSTVEKCLRASLLGMRVRRLIDTYDEFSLDDLNSVIAKVLDEAGNLNGEDFSELKRKSEEMFATLENDPIWSEMAQSVLNEANQVVSEADTNQTVGEGGVTDDG